MGTDRPFIGVHYTRASAVPIYTPISQINVSHNGVWRRYKGFRTLVMDASKGYKTERLGMIRERVLRSYRLVRGERRNEVYYGLLREEWEKQRGLAETGGS